MFPEDAYEDAYEDVNVPGKRYDRQGTIPLRKEH